MTHRTPNRSIHRTILLRWTLDMTTMTLTMYLHWTHSHSIMTYLSTIFQMTNIPHISTRLPTSIHMVTPTAVTPTMFESTIYITDTITNLFKNPRHHRNLVMITMTTGTTNPTLLLTTSTTYLKTPTTTSMTLVATKTHLTILTTMTTTTTAMNTTIDTILNRQLIVDYFYCFLLLQYYAIWLFFYVLCAAILFLLFYTWFFFESSTYLVFTRRKFI